MIKKVLAAGKKGDKLLNDSQKKRLRELNVVERLLFEKLWRGMLEELAVDGGRITSKKGFVSLAKAIDAIFDAVEAEHLGEFAANTAKDMQTVLGANVEQFKPLAQGKDLKAIKSTVDGIMRKRLGIDADNGVVKRGYLDELVRNRAARDEVKKMVAKAVSGGVPMRKLERALKLKVQGTKNTSGVLERNIGGIVLDTYQIADAVVNNQFAQRLGLKYFIYSGGLIETSRAFCRKRNNRVFTTEEAAKWGEDPTLPRTKAEKDQGGAPDDYVPLEDRGRWNCRHRILYIPAEEAYRLRPELRPPAEKKKEG